MNYWRSLTAEKVFFLRQALDQWHEQSRRCEFAGESLSVARQRFFENTCQLYASETWQAFMRELLAYYQIKPRQIALLDRIDLESFEALVGYRPPEISRLTEQRANAEYWLTQLLTQERYWRLPASQRSDESVSVVTSVAPAQGLIASTKVEKALSGPMFWSEIASGMNVFIEQCREAMAEF